MVLKYQKSKITTKSIREHSFSIVWFYFQFEKPGRRDDFDYPEMAKEASKLRITQVLPVLLNLPFALRLLVLFDFDTIFRKALFYKSVNFFEILLIAVEIVVKNFPSSSPFVPSSFQLSRRCPTQIYLTETCSKRCAVTFTVSLLLACA